MQIQLAGRKGSAVTGFAIVDDIDGDLAAFNWHLNSDGYPARKDSRRRTVLLHRVVGERMAGRPLTSTDLVHHRQEDTLDARRDQLELTNRSGHMAIHLKGGRVAVPNRELRRERGTKQVRSGRWQAFCKGRYVGTFDDQEAAITAREETEDAVA